jgi:hypothetical protein
LPILLERVACLVKTVSFIVGLDFGVELLMLTETFLGLSELLQLCDASFGNRHFGTANQRL